MKLGAVRRKLAQPESMATPALGLVGVLSPEKVA